MYVSLRNVCQSQKCTEVSEMLRSLRNVLKNSSVHSNSSKSTEKAIKSIVIFDQHSDIYSVACTRLKTNCHGKYKIANNTSQATMSPSYIYEAKLNAHTKPGQKA